MDRIYFSKCACLLVTLVTFAGCGNDTNILIKEPSSLESLAPSEAGFGDTIIVAGSRFNPVPGANRIVISPNRFSDPVARRVIVPFGGSRTELRGIVGDGSFTGSVRVEDVEPFGSAFSFGVQPPAAASNALPFSARLRSGNVGKAFFSGMNFEFSITAGASDEDYLVVLFSDAVPPDNTWSYLYNVTAQSRAGLAAEQVSSSSQPGHNEAGAGETVSLREGSLDCMGEREREFKRRMNEELEKLLRKAGSGQIEIKRGDRAFRPSISGEGAPSQTVQFNMLVNPDSSSTDPLNFTVVEADLMFSGAHTLLYVDKETMERCPTCLTQTDADGLGQVFDSRIYGTNRNKFGNESDINQDKKVAILLSPVVNRMTPVGSQGFIAGYFLANDLLPALCDDKRVTNGMEIFYGIVPDPSGVFGNIFPKEETLPIIEGVLAHEFFHMILFNYRVLIYGQGLFGNYMEQIWLNEGLAHIAEDVNGYQTSNIKRANLFLDHPGNVTLIYGGDLLDERGAEFLFLRYLGDRYGDGMFKQLVQSKKTGVANIEAATRAFFKELFADWSATCYLSGRGITNDARFSYSSIDLQGDFKPLSVLGGNITGMQMTGFIKSTAPKYVSFAIPADGIVDFTIGSEAAGRMNAVVIRIH